MEFKADALLLRASDYGENDKIATLLTAERGKISAALKGVKRAGAKLRFAAQPFCFAEYVLAARGNRNTVISASLHDAFYAVCEDVTRYYAASVVSDVCDKIALEGMNSGALLVCAVSALEEICADHPLALVKFFLDALDFAGYPVDVGACPACGKIPAGRMRFSFSDGAFFCDKCFPDAVPASESTYLTMRAARGLGQAEAEIVRDGSVRALRLLGTYFSRQVGTELVSLAEYFRLAKPVE